MSSLVESLKQIQEKVDVLYAIADTLNADDCQSVAVTTRQIENILESLDVKAVWLQDTHKFSNSWKPDNYHSYLYSDHLQEKYSNFKLIEYVASKDFEFNELMSLK